MENKTTLAFIAGIVAADGPIRISRPIIEIYSKDKEVLEKLQQILSKIEQTSTAMKVYKTKTKYVLYIYSSTLTATLTKTYKIPRGKKSKTLSFPELPHQEQLEYIKGFIFGDGTFYLEKTYKKSKVSGKTPVLEIYSASLCFLESVKSVMEKFQNT